MDVSFLSTPHPPVDPPSAFRAGPCLSFLAQSSLTPAVLLCGCNCHRPHPVLCGHFAASITFQHHLAFVTLLLRSPRGLPVWLGPGPHNLPHPVTSERLQFPSCLQSSIHINLSPDSIRPKQESFAHGLKAQWPSSGTFPVLCLLSHQDHPWPVSKLHIPDSLKLCFRIFYQNFCFVFRMAPCPQISTNSLFG